MQFVSLYINLQSQKLRYLQIVIIQLTIDHIMSVQKFTAQTWCRDSEIDVLVLLELMEKLNYHWLVQISCKIDNSFWVENWDRNPAKKWN